MGCLHLVAGVPVCQQFHFHSRSPSAFFNGVGGLSAPSPCVICPPATSLGLGYVPGGSPSLSCHMSWAVSLFSTSLVIHREAYQVFCVFNFKFRIFSP